MIEKFNGIFYLIIYLVHFIGVGVYAFQTIFGTKNFMEKFGIDTEYLMKVYESNNLDDVDISNILDKIYK